MKTPETPHGPPSGAAGPDGLDAKLDHAGWIRELAHRLVRDPAAADDVVQDTWAAAVRRPPETDRPLRPWLGRVVRNFAFERARSERHRAAREEEVARAEAQPSAEELVLRAEAQRELVESVLQLTDPYRTTVLLRYYEGLQPKAIAELQGVPAGTVRSRLKRALDELKTRLDARYGGRRDLWASAFVPLGAAPSVAGPPEAGAGTGTGMEPRGGTPGASAAGITTGTQTMITGIKMAVAAAGVLAGASVAWQVVRGPSAEAGQHPALHEVERASAVASKRGASEPGAGPATPDRTIGARQDEREAVEPAPAAPIAGLLLDEETGAPLPEFALRFEDGQGRAETVTTDTRGAFATEGALQGGSVSVHLVDHVSNGERIRLEEGEGERARAELRKVRAAFEELVVEHTADAAARPLELRVPAGPTWSFVLDNPLGADLAGGTAYLFQQGWKEPGHSAWTPLRGEAPVWSRFAAIVAHYMVPKNLGLELRDATGLHAGNARVAATSGEHEARIEIGRRGRFTGTILTTGEEPVSGRGVVLRSASEREAEIRAKSGQPYAYWATTDAEGRFELSWVVPGEYTLYLVVDGEEDFGRPVEIPAGVSEQSFRVPPIRGRGAIAGRVTSHSGTRQDAVRIQLRRAEEFEGRHGLKNERIRWKETESGTVGEFRFESLAAGEYVITPRVHSFLEVVPKELRVTVPGEEAENLELVLRDDTPFRDLVFHVTPASETEKFGFGLFFTLDPAGEARELNSEGREEATIRGVPVGVPFEWTVYASGYLPVRGDELAFASGDEIERVLEPGWGTTIRVFGPDGTTPLANTEVFADGVTVGTTDADGTVILELAEKPGVLRMVHGPPEAPTYVEEAREIRRWAPWIRVVMDDEEGSPRAR